MLRTHLVSFHAFATCYGEREPGRAAGRKGQPGGKQEEPVYWEEPI